MGSEPHIDRGTRPEDTLVAVRGCLPAAAVAIGARGTVVHWGAGARAVFGHRSEEAVGRPASELLPITGALNATARAGDHHWLDGVGDLVGAGEAMTGRARVPVPGGERADVLWWAYPLAAPGPFRLVVLAARAARLQRHRALRGTRVVPGFGPSAWYPEAAELAGRLPRMLGRPQGKAAGPLVSRLLRSGCPVLEVRRPVPRRDMACARC
ncbi:hypothetical protein FM076_27060 [Streptomyces albus subsp. chlorinus]|uniref:hypothetical protein n=1 Tax=Streptomyces albus TaxID=1888 RepID=UPI00156EBFB6|nr:hypothetical protein [Streptomyces albus]NSC24619.1 hypothetical protein [Streptomyces albus subsp. chlorinus]